MKIKLSFLITLLTCVHPAQAQVTNLGIVAVGGQSIIYWPISATNYVLQTTTNLASPNWETASNAVTINAVVVTNSAPQGYFRLREDNTTAGMVLIPAGSFIMGNYLFYGSATNDTDIANLYPTNIYVSAFYLDATEVSYSQWTNVYDYATSLGYDFAHVGEGKASNHPVGKLDWFDCVKWCNARSQQAGLMPVYYTDVDLTDVFTNGEPAMIYADWLAGGYRLPAEAEWEKAARGGLSGLRFPWGNSISTTQANYYGAPGNFSYDLGPDGQNPAFTNGVTPYTSPVGSFPPNGFGLYDMAGNVMEWCWDWKGTPSGLQYGQPTTNNPTGPATGSNRIMRGGSWGFSALYCRCFNRSFALPPSVSDSTFGFRCAKGL